MPHTIHAFTTQGTIPTAPHGHTWDSLMHRALELARQGARRGEVPVGALVVLTSGDIIAEAHNLCIAQHDPTAHAEVLALRMACEKVHNYRLKDAVLVVTLEPCLMCAGALVHARVDGLVYGAADKRAGAISSCCEGLEYGFLNHKVWHMGGIRSEDCAQLLRAFFQKQGGRKPSAHEGGIS